MHWISGTGAKSRKIALSNSNYLGWITRPDSAGKPDLKKKKQYSLRNISISR